MDHPLSDSGKGMDGGSMETRDELLAEVWDLFIRLSDEQLDQLMEYIKKEEGEQGETQT